MAQKDIYDFLIAGASVAGKTLVFRTPAEYSGIRAQVSCKDAPVGGDLVLDLLHEGAAEVPPSFWSDPDDRPTVVAQSMGLVSDWKTCDNRLPLASGSRIQVKLASVGATPAQNVVVILECERS